MREETDPAAGEIYPAYVKHTCGHPMLWTRGEPTLFSPGGVLKYLKCPICECARLRRLVAIGDKLAYEVDTVKGMEEAPLGMYNRDTLHAQYKRVFQVGEEYRREKDQGEG